MPTYDFKCPNCGETIPQKRDFTDNRPGPICGDCLVTMVKVFTPTPAIFKGSGWAKVPRP